MFSGVALLPVDFNEVFWAGGSWERLKKKRYSDPYLVIIVKLKSDMHIKQHGAARSFIYLFTYSVSAPGS